MVIPTPWSPPFIATSTATAASNAETAAGALTSKFVTPASLAYAAPALMGPIGNARAQRGGVIFDNSGAAIVSTLTNQNIGTDSCVVAIIFRVPAANPAAIAHLAVLSSLNGQIPASCLTIPLLTSGSLVAELWNAAGSLSHTLVVSNFVSSYAGKVVHLAFLKNSAGASASFLLNGSTLAATDNGAASPTWAETITSTFLYCGRLAGAQVLVGAVYDLAFYNFALSGADLSELYDLNGTVPERFKWGSQVAKYTSNFSAGVDGWSSDVTITGNTDSVGGEDDWMLVAGSGAGNSDAYFPASMRSGLQSKRVRVQARIRHNHTGGTTFSVADGVTASIPANTTTDIDMVVTMSSLARIMATSSANGESWWIKNVVLTQVGAVLHLPLNDGIGLQLKDESTNALHADMSSSGVAHLIPAPVGTRFAIVKTYAHSDISSLSGTTQMGSIPAGCVPVDFQANVTSALDTGRTVSVGTSGTNNKFVSGLAVDTTGFKQADGLTKVPESSSSATAVYIKKSSTSTSGALVTANLILERKF